MQTLVVGFIGIGSLGMGELAVIGVLAVLLFGGRLPEVARSLGATYQQFRKGLSDIQSSIKTDVDLNSTVDRLNDYSDYHDDYDEPSAPKFRPPTETDDSN
ncbi:MAG: twin-arginine translocase TatA/TatE family subunit [Planctomycetota bacterium]